MYNDTIKVANKIISDADLTEIFAKMNEKIKEIEELNRQEKIANERYESAYQHWTVKDFEGTFKCSFNFYDDTSITVDNYNSFIVTFNNRIRDIKDMWIRYAYSYCIKNGYDQNYITHHINMNIYEHKMDIDVSINSADNRMESIYQLIKDKILTAPERYDRVVRKRTSIKNKIGFAIGVIPSLIILSLLAIVPTIREIYGMTFVLYPICVVVLAYMIGGILFGTKLDRLYSTIVPEKKYAGYDRSAGKSIYTDDIEKYVDTSEIIIGKNVGNIEKRKEILELESKYSSFIPIEIIIIVVMSILVVILGRLV